MISKQKKSWQNNLHFNDIIDLSVIILNFKEESLLVGKEKKENKQKLVILGNSICLGLKSQLDFHLAQR